MDLIWLDGVLTYICVHCRYNLQNVWQICKTPRASASRNYNSTLFYHPKKLLYHYIIPFYNTTNIPKFYFPILLLKIIYLHNKIIYPKTQIKKKPKSPLPATTTTTKNIPKLKPTTTPPLHGNPKNLSPETHGHATTIIMAIPHLLPPPPQQPPTLPPWTHKKIHPKIKSNQ